MTKERMIPAGKSAYKMLPDFLKRLIAGAARDLKDKPWYFAYQITGDFKKMIVVTNSQGKTAPPDENEVAGLNFALGNMVAALIERIGGHPTKCTDAYQARVYEISTRKDHRRSAGRYIKKAGGERGLCAEMDAWRASHKTETEEPGTILVRAGEFPGEGPQTMEETLDLWTKRAMEQFDAAGGVKILHLGMKPDGSGMMFQMDYFKNDAQKHAAFEMVTSQFAERGLPRHVMVYEAWACPVDSPVRPKDSATRQEILVVRVLEYEKEIFNMFEIERDWSSGKGTLSPPQREGGIHAPREYTP